MDTAIVHSIQLHSRTVLDANAVFSRYYGRFAMQGQKQVVEQQLRVLLLGIELQNQSLLVAEAISYNPHIITSSFHWPQYIPDISWPGFTLHSYIRVQCMT